MATADLQPLLTINDVARLLSVSRPTVYALVRRGDLPAVRVSERLRFEPEAIRVYLAGKREQA